MEIQSSERHLRQIILPDIGKNGQDKLKNSSVLVIGAGGLGSPALYYLAAAGVGTLHIVDNDVVAPSNLNRQILYRESDVGYPKAERACLHLCALDGSINCIPHVVSVGEDNIVSLCNGIDIIVDCVDNIQSRHVVNKAAVSLRIPLVEAGIYAFDGYLFPIIPHQSACFACMGFHNAQQPTTPIPVIGATAGMLGAMQAAIAIRMLIGLPVPVGVKHIYSLVDLSKIAVPVPRNPNCPVCGEGLED